MKEQEKKILERISDIYLFLIIVLFPLIVDKTGYFHILECKWKSYILISILYFCSIIFTLLYYKIRYKEKYLTKLKFNKIHLIIFLFLLINILSCMFSPFFNKYNLLIGEGRGEGLIIILIYILSFVFVSLFSKLKKTHLLYFSISSILVSMIGIIQYLGFNPFNLYKEGLGFYNCWYITTIGNVDTISAIYCILLPISFAAFIFLNNKKYENIIHLLSIFLGFFMFGIINVQSGKVAFIVTLILLVPIILSKSIYLKRFFIILSTFLFSYCSHILINSQYSYNLNKFIIKPQINIMVLVFLLSIVILLIFANRLDKLEYDFFSNKKLIRKIYINIFFMFLAFLLFLFFCDVKHGMLHEMHELLNGNFNDKFGSYRIFLWKRTLKLIKEYPLLGSGCDSFAIRFMAKYTKDVMAIGPLTINDTAANVYLTTVINVGIIGLIAYISFLFSYLKNAVKNQNKLTKIILVAVICYIIQDFFNFSVVIVTPIYWILLGLGMSGTKENCRKLLTKVS